MGKQNTSDNSFITRPPIVTVLGHVDHGKTTLLDTIRKTNIASKEAGGITQHIAAYQVEIPYIENKSKKTSYRKITFIDTPGHQAFAKMRSRGANVADIAILVVAANDGVMPQTIESIEYILAAKIPCIVAVNKIDLPDTNIEKIKKQLVKMNLLLEEYGGETPVIPLSAKNGEGVQKLLDMIILLSELNQLKEDNPGKFKGVVIESELSKSKGPIATIISRSGNLIIGEEVFCLEQSFKLRALTDWRGKNINRLSAGDPAEVLGWKTVPPVGTVLYKKEETGIIQPIKQQISQIDKSGIIIKTDDNTSIEEEKIKLIIKADTAGTLEAILESMKKNPNILIVESGIGMIKETDIFLAKTTKALVIGFHQKTQDQIAKLAESEKVIIKTYSIIYELLDEIDEVVEAVRSGNLVKILGEAKVLALFNIKDIPVIGIKVINNRIAKGDQIKAMRDNKEIGRAKIKSLRHGKEDITKAEQGTEAGMVLSQKIDLLTGDSIISIG